MGITRITTEDVKDSSLTDADVNALNKDGAVSTPSLRTLGTGSDQACAGDDVRLSDDRTTDGVRTTTTIVKVDSSAAPTPGQILVAVTSVLAEWQTPVNALTESNFVDNEEPSGIINGVNDTFTLANTPVPGSEKIFKNGIRMRIGASRDYTIAGGTIIFNAGAIPQTGNSLWADYRIP